MQVNACISTWSCRVAIVDLDDARAIALRLPGTHEEPHFDLTSFRTGTKIFATAPADGDHLRIMVDESEIMACVAEDPAVFGELWWGKKLGGLQVALGAADPTRVAELLEDAWRRKAPKRAVAAHDADRSSGGGPHGVDFDD
jgi:hypothetical protein